jgi:hypothetical protein
VENWQSSIVHFAASFQGHQRHQTVKRLVSSAATTSTLWRVRELYLHTTYVADYLMKQYVLQEAERRVIMVIINTFCQGLSHRMRC